MTATGRGRADLATDRRRMAAAISLGARGLGETAPNPSVGCVIFDADGAVIGRGRTGRGGRPHAERAALENARRDAPDRLGGATVYVTLEPCAHFGKTPPCADALVEAGVARVVSALEDPDPRVSGAGHSKLRAAGVAVTVGVRAEEAADLHRGHLKRITDGLPYLTLKLAATIDGRIATRDGESQWITSATARRRAHLFRARHDAVMVGVGTALADDPRLNVRLAGHETRRPIRVVLDSKARTPLASRLVQGCGPDGPRWILHGPDAPAEARAALAAAGARLIEVEADAQARLDARTALTRLAAEGVERVFCEGGGGLAASLLKARRRDRRVVASARMTLGGDAIPAVAEMAIARLADSPNLTLHGAWLEGPEAWTDWRRPE